MWNDPDIEVDWPVEGIEIKLSEKDKINPTLKEIEASGFKFAF